MRKSGLIVVGIIIGLVMSIPLQAIAESVSKIGKKVDVEVPVRVNGELLDTMAIGLEGTTYTPARALAETLGAKVDWDPESGEVVIETKAGDEQETPPDEKGDGVEITREIPKTVEDIDWEIKMLEIRNKTNREFILSHEGQDDISEQRRESLKKAAEEIKENEARIAELEAAKKALEAELQE